MELFNKFKQEHNKKYSIFEEEQKFAVFLKNLKEIHSLNESEEGAAEFGVTQFADMTTQQFKEKILMPVVSPKQFE